MILKHLGPVPVHRRPRLHRAADRAHRVPRDGAAALCRRLRGGGARGDDELRGAERRAGPRRPVPARPRQGQAPGPAPSSSRTTTGSTSSTAGSAMPAARRRRRCAAFSDGGVHIDLCSLLFLRHLPELVEEGRIEEEDAAGAGRRDAADQGARRPARRPACRAPTPTARRSCSSGADRPPIATLARASVVLLRPTRPDPAVLPIPTGARSAALRARAAGGPAAGGLARRLLEPRQPPSRPGHDAARRDQAALARRDATPAAATTTSTATTGEALPASSARRPTAAALAREATHVVLLPRRVATSGAANRRRSPSRGCRKSSGGWCELVRRANPDAKLDRLRHRRPGAAHPARDRGERRRDLLDGAPRELRRRRHRRHPRGGLQPDRRGSRTACRSPTGSPRASTRAQARVDRPAVPVVPGSASRRQRHHWCAYYLGLGARWPAAYTFGEGYSYTSLRALRLVARRGARSRSAAGTHGHRQRPGHQHRQPRRHRDRAPLLSGHGLRGAGAAPAGAARPPAGDARPRRVARRSPSRSRRRCWRNTAAIPRPGRASGPTAIRRRTPTGCSWSSTRARRSTPSSASATRRACCPSRWCRSPGSPTGGMPMTRGSEEAEQGIEVTGDLAPSGLFTVAAPRSAARGGRGSVASPSRRATRADTFRVPPSAAAGTADRDRRGRPLAVAGRSPIRGRRPGCSCSPARATWSSRADADGSEPWPARVRFVAQDGRPIAPTAQVGSAAGDAGPFLIAKRFAAGLPRGAAATTASCSSPAPSGGTSFWNQRWNPGDDLYENLVALARSRRSRRIRPGGSARCCSRASRPTRRTAWTPRSSGPSSRTSSRASAPTCAPPSFRSSSANCRRASSAAEPERVGDPRRGAARATAPRPTPPSRRAASPSVADDDGLHYSTAGLLCIGERYAAALAAAEANTLAGATAQAGAG